MFLRRSTVICREGWYYLLVLGFVVTGSFLREVNLLLVLAGMMVFPFLLNLRTTAISLRGLTVRRRIPEMVSAGDPFVVDVMLSRRPRRTRLGGGASWAVLAEDVIRSEVRGRKTRRATPLMFWRLPSGQQQRLSYRCRLMKRGRYRFGPIKLSSRFPLGLVRRTKRVDMQDNLVVLPRLGRLTDAWARLYQEVHLGSLASHHKYGILDGDFHSLRDWRPGDSRRRIHWRTTARRGSPVVRQFEQHREEDLTLLVDLWEPPSPDASDEETVEQAVRFAATVVTDICRRGSSYLCVGTTGRDVTLEGGPASTGLMRELLEKLAVAAADSHDRLPELLASAYDMIPAGMTVVVISPRALEVAQLEQAAGLWDNTNRRRATGRIVTIQAGTHEMDEFFVAEPLPEIRR